MGKSDDRTRVLLWGLGAMGSGMASMLLENPDVEIVAAVASRPTKAGKDLGEVIGKAPTGVIVTTDVEEAFESKPDIVLQSTASFVKEVFAGIEISLEHDANVIT
ncbi:MAG TPA: NADP-binding protein, partial [Firmicutes bacterium]|nr:NADP-binding protein [Bacillota bacterium]